MQARWPSALVVAIVIGIQLLAWGVAELISVGNPALVALFGLAYFLGIRHGLDVDHIAAIDNVSRDLIGRGIRPVGLGLYFALGHSSMVTLGSLAAAGVAIRFDRTFGHFREWVSAYSTLISIILLLLVAPRNLILAWRGFRELRSGAKDRHRCSHHGARAGWISAALSRVQVKTWHMLFIGALFGLGFETSTAIAVLSMTGTQAASGATWVCILIFPFLFTAGMTLVDAIDAIFMEFAYGWAIRRPGKHAIYNLVITGFSAAVALLVGGLEIFTLLQRRSPTDGGWPFVRLIESHFDAVGATVVLTVAGIWLVALIKQWPSGRSVNSRDRLSGSETLTTEVAP